MLFLETRSDGYCEIGSAFRLFLLLAGLLVPLCAAKSVEAQVKSNLSSSVTSESMTAVWVATSVVCSKSTAWTCSYFDATQSPGGGRADCRRDRCGGYRAGHLVNAGTRRHRCHRHRHFSSETRLSAQLETRHQESRRAAGQASRDQRSRVNFAFGFLIVGFAGSECRSGKGPDRFLDDSGHRDESSPGA